MNVLEVAQLMDAVYNRRASLTITESISASGMEAHFVKDPGIFVIEGTNSAEDWWDFNLNIFGYTGTIKGDSGARYHEGFWKQAQLAYNFAKPFRRDIKLVVGHSLGAASAQIVGPSLEKRTISFASPKPLLRGKAIRPHLVTNYCRDDDLVCRVPPGIFDGALGFEHIGNVVWLTPEQRNLGEDHRIDKYVELLERNPELGQQEIIFSR